MDLKLNILKIILFSVLLSSCKPLELFEANLYFKIFIIIMIIVGIFGFLDQFGIFDAIRNRREDFRASKNFEEHTLDNLDTIYWLLIIVIILLGIILWKIW